MTTTHIVTCLINCDTDFRQYRDGNRLAYDTALVLTIEAKDADDAANQAFEIGNRIKPDAEGKQWPSWCRSLSVGDVLIVAEWEHVKDVAVAPLGFTEIALNHLGPWNAPGGRSFMARTGHARPIGEKA